jgi:hypothetical protein
VAKTSYNFGIEGVAIKIWVYGKEILSEMLAALRDVENDLNFTDGFAPI